MLKLLLTNFLPFHKTWNQSQTPNPMPLQLIDQVMFFFNPKYCFNKIKKSVPLLILESAYFYL